MHWHRYLGADKEPSLVSNGEEIFLTAIKSTSAREKSVSLPYNLLKHIHSDEHELIRCVFTQQENTIRMDH